jgi:hypothetical protein
METCLHRRIGRRAEGRVPHPSQHHREGWDVIHRRLYQIGRDFSIGIYHPHNPGRACVYAGQPTLPSSDRSGLQPGQYQPRPRRLRSADGRSAALQRVTTKIAPALRPDSHPSPSSEGAAGFSLRKASPQIEGLQPCRTSHKISWASAPEVSLWTETYLHRRIGRRSDARVPHPSQHHREGWDVIRRRRSSDRPGLQSRHLSPAQSRKGLRGTPRLRPRVCGPTQPCLHQIGPGFSPDNSSRADRRLHSADGRSEAHSAQRRRLPPQDPAPHPHARQPPGWQHRRQLSAWPSASSAPRSASNPTAK